MPRSVRPFSFISANSDNRLFQVENELSSVERVLHYANSLEQEAPPTIEATKPSANWPAAGAISIKNVVMSYREGLPAVLKDISVEIKGGEKIGVVGRTGAGKSSIMLALFRVVELSSSVFRFQSLVIVDC